MRPTIAIYGIQDRHNFAFPGFTHDHSICRMEGGRITHYLQLERRTRRKYDNQMHLHLEELMDEEIIPFSLDSDLVFVNSFAGNCFLSQNGRIRFEQMPRTTLTPDVLLGYGWVETANRQENSFNFFAMDHELAHVCSNLPFHGPFRENALLVHFDGGASLGNFSAFQYKNGKLEGLECHWELSHLSKFFNDNALAFALLSHTPGEHCAVPGKLMGFATLGRPDAQLRDWLRQSGWFKDMWKDHAVFYRAAKSDWGWQGKLGDTHDPFLQNLAACFQAEFEEVWLNYLFRLQERINAGYLYLSGGCALNIVANTRIINAGWFQDVFIPPCPGDSGLSIGAAAFMEWKKYGKVELNTPYLNNAGLKPVPWKYDQQLIRKVGDALAEGRIIGVANGPAEAGPRALGNRSILARPDSKPLAEKVSRECKGREWYRPIAPVMLEKHAKKLTDLNDIHHLSRYMLLDFKIPTEKQIEIQGVVHANGTARIQTLFGKQQNPFLWDLLSYLDEVHHVPALINTSFNKRGEPIVHTPTHARKSALEMGLDGLVSNFDFQLIKSSQDHELERH